MQKYAKLVKTLERGKGHAALYELSGGRVVISSVWQFEEEYEMPTTKYVVVSAVPYTYEVQNDPETLIFAADETGKVLNFLDLPGSFRGGCDHKKALAGLGYPLADV